MNCLYIKTRPFSEDFFGGVRAHTVGIVNGFLDAGIDVTVLCECKISDIRAEQKCVFSCKNIIDYNREIYVKTKEFLSTNDNRYDFIYSRFSPSVTAPAKLATEFGIPHITEYNSSTLTAWKEVRLPEILKNGSLLKKLAAVCLSPFRCTAIDIREKYILHHSKYIVTVSDVLQTELEDRGIDRTKILVCPNGVDPKVFSFNKDKRRLVRSHLDIADDQVLVGFSGTYGKWHGIPVLSEAITKLKDNKHIKFLLIGSGMMHYIIQNEQKDNTQVFSLSKVPFCEMPDYLSACDILMITNEWKPSDKKPFFGSPTKLFEYMATGRAIIASKLDQIDDILTDNETCIFFEPGNAQLLAQAIQQLSNAPELRDKLGTNAYKQVVQKFTWQQNCKRIVNTICVEVQ